MFGSQLFGGTFRGTLNHGFNADYVLAIGDRVNLRMWGAVNYEASLVIDQQGNLFIPNVGPIPVSGVRSGEVNSVLERNIRKVYKNNVGIYASLDASQPVKVYVTGFVRQPGLYGGLASDSPIAYLDKAGGVDPERGSYVDIVVKRGGQVRKRVNLYAFLLDGILDILQFQDGDVIVVGSRKHTVSVSGEALNAFDFEFSEPSFPLSAALNMAKAKPGTTHVSITRRQGVERRTEYYPLQAAGNIQLQDGDAVTLTADRYAGTIQVRVEGAHSGEHALVLPYGATLKDVLAQVKPNSMSRLDAIQFYRKSVQARQKEMLEVSLRKIEEAALSARSKTAEEASLRGKEAELIMKFVERARLVQPKGQVVLDDHSRETTLLEDSDLIVIPERSSIVMVHGEVLFPSAISWVRDATAEDYIQSSGGLTQGADTSKVVIITQNGSTRLADVQNRFFNRGDAIGPGDEIMVLPRIETKSAEFARALTQILYQIAFTAKVAFGL
ncbi:MAG: polysaccharide biosynthesis/export family protein [Candidatus Accumulibacter sp.]|nr:polysaccharide biosynthesis/export family protein [Accumulibacter sp.]